ncbi:MAG: tetratricopeptide repeat protein [Acidobacteriaceae bacterium]|jgi:predicted O-linked N-acetylglucosamine transferase (SPINDLY family)
MKSKPGKPLRHSRHRPANPPPAIPAPSPIDALLQQAIAHHQASQLPQAEALYRQVLESHPNHPVALHLLGVIACQTGQPADALELIDRAIASDPDNAEFHFNRANALFMLRQHHAAVESYDRALRLNPRHAEAWHNRGSALHTLKQYSAALESHDRALALNPDYAEAHSNRGNALYALGQYQAALESCDRALALRPDYPEALNNRGSALQGLKQYRQAVASYDRAIQLRPDFADAYTNRGNALQALTLADENFSKHASSGRDLVFYCGPATETWNPGSVNTTGIGGSEEAILWLSRLLYRRGWNVTVYANCGQHEQVYDGVTWKPYWLWNYRDRQDVTVLWRYPHLAQYDINSGKVILDLHDVFSDADLPPVNLARIHKIFVKSRFHRSLFPAIPDDKFSIVPNGIDAQLFDAAPPRDPLLLINTSSADRSLEAFLDCFEQIKLQVPSAKAEWAYGWDVWDTFHASNPTMLQWKTALQTRMRQLGVAELGRISHADVARLYLRANIFAYPSEMAEIDCISLSKAMAAGAIPITTDFAALGEKSGHGGVFIHSTKTKDNWILPGQLHVAMTDPEQKAQFVRAAVDLLRNPPAESDRDSMRAWARSSFDWNSVADAWHQALTDPPPLLTALESHDQALRLNPNRAGAHNNRGSVLHSLRQYEAALESYDRAIALQPDYVDAHRNRGDVLMALKQYPSALESFNHALQLDPGCEYLSGLRLFTKRALCDWQDDAADLRQVEAAIARGERAAIPFATLAFSESPALQMRAAEIYTLDQHPTQPALAAIPRRPRCDRIRIGYFSADFYNHATSYLMAELFERHDRTRFEIIGFSFGPDRADQMSRRVSSAMDRFLDVRNIPDRQIAELSRSLEVDIAVDLKGFTRDHRAGIFSYRAAPIQVNYLGYPGTMAAGYIDYLIADPTIIPDSSRGHYTEKIVRLPDSYQPNDRRRPISTAPRTRADEGIPDAAFVFCCFNNTYKITPAVFDLWMRILARVDSSVLWLLEENPATIANLRAEAARRNIAPERLIFARPLPLPEHLARHALADLFLDTLPYNAHTTASDALWTGLPLLTRSGETFAGRVAASLLRAMALPESDLAQLIATSESDYEQRAISLAHSPARLQSLRRLLQQSRLTAPLFDTPTFTRHLEAAYTAIYDRYHAALSPDHIDISA